MDKQKFNILSTYANFLHAAIQDGGTFFSRYSDDRLSTAVRMAPQELKEWGKVFDFETLIGRERLSIARGPGSHRVNNDDGHTYMQAYKLPPEAEVTLFLRTRVYFSGYMGGPGYLYNAFIDMDVYAKDENDNWVLSEIPGTGMRGELPVLSPFTVTGMSLWFNTRVKADSPNSFKVTEFEKSREIMMTAEIHDLPALKEMELPKDDRMELFFWQMGRKKKLPLPVNAKFQAHEGFIPLKVGGNFTVRPIPVYYDSRNITGKTVRIMDVNYENGFVQVMPLEAILNGGGVSRTIPFTDLV